MKAYVMTTGTLFAFLASVHVLKVVAEWPAVLQSTSEMAEAGVGVAGLVLATWAFRLLRSVRA